MAGPFISFLTDFGGETAPAICRGVIWSIAADARILDLNHGPAALHPRRRVPPVASHRLPARGRPPRGRGPGRRDGPAGHRDPRVARRHPGRPGQRPAAAGRPRARRDRGGPELTNTELFLPRVSSTFHGRDIFAPVAARLAAGLPFPSVGPLIEAAALVDLVLPVPVARDGGLDSVVVFIDPFGNVRLAGGREDLERIAGPLVTARPLRVRIKGAKRPLDLTGPPRFGDVPPGTAIAYDDAETAGLAIAVNQGSAAETFGLALDDVARIEPA